MNLVNGRLLGTPLAIALSTVIFVLAPLSASKVKIVAPLPVQSEEVLVGEVESLFRSLETPARTQVQPAPAVPVALGFEKIVQKQSKSGSVVFLAPQRVNGAPGGNPFGFSVLQIVPQLVNGVYSFALTGLAKERPALLNGAQAPLVAAGATYLNPLYNATVEHLACMGDDVVAVPQGSGNIFVLAGGNPDALISTADANAAAARPAAVQLTPLRDAAGTPLVGANAIKSLATSDNKIFAAVPTSGTLFTADSANRGVAVVAKQGNVLVQAPANASRLSFNTVDGDAVARLTRARIVGLFGAAGVNRAIKVVLLAGATGSDARAGEINPAGIVAAVGAAAVVNGAGGFAGLAGGGALNNLAADPLAQVVGATLDGLAAPGVGTNLGDPGYTDAILADPATLRALSAAIDGAPVAENARKSLVKAVVLAAAQGKNVDEVFAVASQAAQASVVGAAVGAGVLAQRATLATNAHESGVVMHYSPELDRLFVGYKNLRKNTIAQQGALNSILVGEPDVLTPGGFNFTSLLHAPSKAVFQDDANAATQNLADKIFTMYHGHGIGNNANGLVAAVGNPLVARQFAAGQNPVASVQHLKTMRTSTGRDYLIVASSIKAAALGGGGMVPGGGAAAKELAGVYCLPLMGQRAFDAPKTAAAPWQIGKLATADAAALLSGLDPAAGAGDALAAGAPAVAVRNAQQTRLDLPTHQANVIFEGRVSGWAAIPAGALPNVSKIGQLDDVKDMQIVGDSVILSFERSVNAADDQMFGVYQTTAIFDNDGKIARWSPLERIGGAAERVKAASVDTVSGNVMYLGNNGEIFNASDWSSNKVATKELQNLVTKYFPASKGGIRSTHVFDDATPSFDQRNLGVPGGGLRVKKMALTVVLGYDTVAVIQTLKDNRPARHFYDAAGAAVVGAPVTFDGDVAAVANVFVFNNDALKQIAPLTSAEVLKVNEAAGVGVSTLGYLYVGGYRGMCRLENAGAGWETKSFAAGNPLTGLSDFGGHVAAGATFVKLNNPVLKNIVKLLSTTGASGSRRVQFAVMTDDKVIHVGARLANAAQSLAFDRALLGANDDYRELNNLSQYAPLFDIAIVKNTGNTSIHNMVVAAAGGLIVTNVLGATHVQPLDGNDIPLQLAYVARSRGGVTIGGTRGANGGAGMLYVLAGDQAAGTVKLYRFEVVGHDGANAVAPANVLTRVGGAQPITLDAFRRYFATDGYRFFFGHDAALDTGEMFNMRSMTNATAASLPLTFALGNVTLGDFIVPPVRDAVTGAWMIGGSFGLKAND